jgi:hypothetical protein
MVEMHRVGGNKPSPSAIQHPAYTDHRPPVGPWFAPIIMRPDHHKTSGNYIQMAGRYIFDP